MWRLYQFPLCPFSRKVRLMLGEKGIAYELREVIPWQDSLDYRDLNPLGCTPAMHEPDRGIVLVDSGAICEFFEETVPERPMLPGSAEQRAEIRRLIVWFEQAFYAQVAWPLLRERVIERSRHDQAASDEVMAGAVRAADTLLDEIDIHLDRRRWLGGTTLSLADLAAAAQISIADYLGGIDWAGHEQARTWYSVLKSRPSFLPLLAERMAGIEPPPHYANVNA